MTTTRWAVVGLVAALTLLALGGLLGYRAGTSSDEEHRLWKLETKQLVDSLELAHAIEIAALTDGLAADSAARVAAEQKARREEARSREVQAEADTLRAELAFAEHQRDSLRIYPALVEKLDSAVSRETARGDALEVALTAEKQSTARLTRMVGTQVAIIGQLQEQVARMPRPQRHRGVRILGMDIKPCAFAGMNTEARTATGVGICLTR